MSKLVTSVLSFLVCVGICGSNASAQPVSVVLVHGAFENSSVWDKVVRILQDDHIHVVAVQLPLLSVRGDAETVSRVLDDQKSNVVLVGHSYGGSVITEAGNDRNVKALVYVAATAPNSGQSGLNEATPYPKPALLRHLFVDRSGFAYATAAGINDLGQDLPESDRRVLMATQCPIALTAFSGKVTTAAWHKKPSWVIVADNDHAISPQEEADNAVRLKATTIHVTSSHLVMLTKPSQVAAAIMRAANWVERQP